MGIAILALALAACGGSGASGGVEVSESRVAVLLERHADVIEVRCARSEPGERTFRCRARLYDEDESPVELVVTVSEAGDSVSVDRCEAADGVAPSQRDPCAEIH